MSNVRTSVVSSGTHIFQDCAKCGCSLLEGITAIEVIGNGFSEWYHTECYTGKVVLDESRESKFITALQSLMVTHGVTDLVGTYDGGIVIVFDGNPDSNDYGYSTITQT